MIRLYQDADAGTLAPIHSAVFADDPLSATAFHNHVSAMLAVGGKVWTISGDKPRGYALVVPVPGLPHIGELNGCIAPAWRRQGLGSKLLQRVLSDLRPTAVRQVTCRVHNLHSAGSLFLQKNAFYIEHEEWLMTRDNLLDLAEPESELAPQFATYSHDDTIAHFLQMYRSSFSGHPWDQPYTKREVELSLDKPEDILFLTIDDHPVGFAWLHLKRDGLGVIEPLGVLPDYQQRGYGRYLLLCALNELARRGAARARIGVWRSNQAAVRLYQSLGFVRAKTNTFLGIDVAA